MERDLIIADPPEKPYRVAYRGAPGVGSRELRVRTIMALSRQDAVITFSKQHPMAVIEGVEPSGGD
jgi:hypothetical protein